MKEITILAGGCFWCMEKPYHEYEGILEVQSGYSGGHEINPSYMDVKEQKTEHLEVVRIVFDPSIITFEQILDIYLYTIDPFDTGGQFIDRGDSYCTAIFYANENQYTIAQKKLKNLEDMFKKKVGVVLRPIMPFYTAEEYHQDYARKNPEAYAKEVLESGRTKKNTILKFTYKDNFYQAIFQDNDLIEIKEVPYELYNNPKNIESLLEIAIKKLNL